jgi:hypothetical protein
MRWIVKRKFPESVIGVYTDEEQARAIAGKFNSDYQCDNYIAEAYETERFLGWLSKALLKN